MEWYMSRVSTIFLSPWQTESRAAIFLALGVSALISLVPDCKWMNHRPFADISHFSTDCYDWTPGFRLQCHRLWKCWGENGSVGLRVRETLSFWVLRNAFWRRDGSFITDGIKTEWSSGAETSLHIQIHLSAVSEPKRFQSTTKETGFGRGDARKGIQKILLTKSNKNTSHPSLMVLLQKDLVSLPFARQQH